jgi:hypothetical protein
MDPVEHSEWQFFLVPKEPAEVWPQTDGMVQRGAYNTHQVEGVAVTTPEKVRAAPDELYTKHPKPYAVSGVCHQASALVAKVLGLDPVRDVARHIDSMWATRLKFGRFGCQSSEGLAVGTAAVVG